MGRQGKRQEGLPDRDQRGRHLSSERPRRRRRRRGELRKILQLQHRVIRPAPLWTCRRLRPCRRDHRRRHPVLGFALTLRAVKRQSEAEGSITLPPRPFGAASILGNNYPIRPKPVSCPCPQSALRSPPASCPSSPEGRTLS